MRALLAVSLLSLSAAAATPELELQGGWLHGTDFSIDPGAAELAARVGADFGHLTLSGRLSAVAGSSVSEFYNPFQPEPGVSGWSALGEVRVHSLGPVQGHLAGAVGVAQLSTFQVDRTETRPLHGDAAFGWRVSTGVTFGKAVAFSLEAALSGWNGLRAAAPPGQFQRGPDPLAAFSLLGGLVFRFGR